MKDRAEYLCGVEAPAAKPWRIFAPAVLEFLDAVSREIRGKKRAPGEDEEIRAFGFWCRRANMESFRKRYEADQNSVGRGIIFHVAPSNVPVLFAYSLVMGLLAGNGCAVKLSSKCGEQDREMCRLMGSVLARPEFAEIRERISIFSCGRENELVRDWCGKCDGIVVWGGDQTIQAVRGIPMRPDAVQMVFPNRFSACVLDTAAVGACSDGELAKLARRFYNDTYAMDQNACSSPQFIVWNQEDCGADASLAQKRWWRAVAEEAGRYPLTAYKAVAKYEQLCKFIVSLDGNTRVEKYHNLLYTMWVDQFPEEPEQFCGKFGMFLQYRGEWKKAVRRLAVRQLQTLTYYGVCGQELVDYVIGAHLQGIQRVVPVGSAMNMELIWDGQDFIRTLSRSIGQG